MSSYLLSRTRTNLARFQDLLQSLETYWTHLEKTQAWTECCGAGRKSLLDCDALSTCSNYPAKAYGFRDPAWNVLHSRLQRTHPWIQDFFWRWGPAGNVLSDGQHSVLFFLYIRKAHHRDDPIFRTPASLHYSSYHTSPTDLPQELPSRRRSEQLE